MRIVLAGYVPPSNNVLLRTHWAKRRKDKLNLHWWIFAETLDAKCAKFEEKRKVTITAWRKRPLDKDNLVGGCKQIIDILKDLGLIYDDSPQYIDLKVEQILCGADKICTEIVIK